MAVTIYHNPRCSKSRQTLSLLQEKGIEPEIIEYLSTPPTPVEIKEIINKLGISARELMRNKEDAYKENGLDNNNLDEDDRIFYNTSSANCDYCGLSLSVQMLLFNKIKEINLDKEIDILFNEPFSKIFSSIDSTKHGDEGMNIRSFACNKTENGKQYHPYCFDIIQESKKGSKK